LEPVFLHLGEALEIHRDQVKRYGGSEGIRDMGLLESALAAPQSGVYGRYAHVDLFEMAAA
jgi:death-on-curing protein